MSQTLTALVCAALFAITSASAAANVMQPDAVFKSCPDGYRYDAASGSCVYDFDSSEGGGY